MEEIVGSTGKYSCFSRDKGEHVYRSPPDKPNIVGVSYDCSSIETVHSKYVLTTSSIWSKLSRNPSLQSPALSITYKPLSTGT